MTISSENPYSNKTLSMAIFIFIRVPNLCRSILNGNVIAMTKLVLRLYIVCTKLALVVIIVKLY